ncbi:hypothetical protein AC579_10550 [Pseudocercospora musae]|uniref:RING-type domain-containing protein n=1 Tax=Pseudocercospora musae TaxID=113226 RepID=A0A139IHK4_9PEZI|nr:hypothetical protein AC579_10550 [Pseudocercospora musae]
MVYVASVAHDVMDELTDPEHVENGGHHQKFMVCDHCRAHGLPCNEAAVCDQCQLFEQPCIHKWCPNSRDSKADCSNNACRYTHRDSITTTEGEPTWIVVYGNLSGHWSHGRVAARSFDDEETSPGFQGLNTRQFAAVTYLNTQVQQGLGTLETLHYPCRCQFEQSGRGNSENRITISSQADPPHAAPLVQYWFPRSLREFVQTFPETEAVGEDHETDGELADLECDDLRDMDFRGRECCCSCGSRENYIALYRCGHWQCHACATVARNQYPWRCPICTRLSLWAFFVNDKSMTYQEFNLEDFEISDRDLGIRYETAMIRRDSMWILERATSI